MPGTESLHELTTVDGHVRLADHQEHKMPDTADHAERLAAIAQLADAPAGPARALGWTELVRVVPRAAGR